MWECDKIGVWKLFGNCVETLDLRKEIVVKKKRLSIDLPEEIHKELKFLALLHNTTITKLVIRTILALIKQLKVKE